MVVVYPSFFPVDKTGAANGVVVLLIFPLAILSWSSFHVHWFLLEIAGTLWYPRVGRRASILPGICTYTQGGGTLGFGLLEYIQVQMISGWHQCLNSFAWYHCRLLAHKLCIQGQWYLCRTNSSIKLFQERYMIYSCFGGNWCGSLKLILQHANIFKIHTHSLNFLACLMGSYPRLWEGFFSYRTTDSADARWWFRLFSVCRI